MARKRLLIEGFKLAEGKSDGCFRYTYELLKGLVRLHEKTSLPFHVDAIIGERIMPLEDVSSVLDGSLRKYERRRARIDEVARLRQRLADAISARSPEWVEHLRRIDRKLSLTRRLEEAHVGTQQALKSPAYDLIHLTLPQAFRLTERLDTTDYLVTVHDCTHRLFPEFHTWENVDTCEQGLQFALDRKARFITVSKSAREDLIRLYNVSPEKVEPIHLGRDGEAFRPVTDPRVLARIRKKYGIPEKQRYILTLSTLEPRKNLSNTLKAFRLLLQRQPHLDVNLVIAGRLGWKYDQLLADMENFRRRVIFTDFVEEKDLSGLYSGATLFSFVSQYEGFGLPALEAMSCGVPVVYGNRGSLPEVVDGAGLAADPNDLEQMSDAFALLLAEEEERLQLIDRALQRASEFSWPEAIGKTVAVYESILADQGQERDEGSRQIAESPSEA